MNATYRLQLTPDFRFADAEKLVPLLARLGVSHLYLSPITDARLGSTHGYDVVDHCAIREELGGEAAFGSLVRAADAAGMKVILDFVPNHAGVGPRNARWQDVLAYGKASPFAHFFDIDWEPIKPELRGKVLLPFLGSSYGECLDKKEIGIAAQDGRLYATYYRQRFALAPWTYPDVIRPMGGDLERLMSEYVRITPGNRDACEQLRARLLEAGELPIAELSIEEMHALLEKQHFRLAWWKTAGSEINYRRFFSINELVALRQEEREVFEDTHGLLRDLLKVPAIDGVRVDHVDGLADPAGYLAALRSIGAGHVWVEKILAHDESLPDWPVDGTTGYEVAADIAKVLTDPRGERRMDTSWRLHVRRARDWEDEVHRGKRLVMRSDLSGELEVLSRGLDRISEADWRTRDFTREALREALAEIIAAIPRYRTYRMESEVIRGAVATALERNRALDPTVFAFVEKVLLEGRHPAWIARFQQYTAPVAAKGVEDTAFYRHVRFAAHCEVGSGPETWSLDPAEFHARAARRPRLNMNATSTHDTKRGEDLRMRMLVLAEMPAEWSRAARRLRAIAEKHATPLPGDSDLYLFFQTLAGLWEGGEDLENRLVAYAIKAAREAKLHTGWMQPNEEYEERLENAVRGVIRDPETPEAIGPLARALAEHGFSNTIAQVVLKTALPGVPDVYRGCETLDLTLVDPDNRRTVDFARRARLLAEIEPLLEKPDGARVREILARRDDLAKTWLLAAMLRVRKANAAAFAGGYEPVEATGERAEHVLAFRRENVVVAVTRFPARLSRAGGLGATRLALSGHATHALTGEKVDLAAPLDAAVPLVVIRAS